MVTGTGGQDGDFLIGVGSDCANASVASTVIRYSGYPIECVFYRLTGTSYAPCDN